jgi:hypothetical protein
MRFILVLVATLACAMAMNPRTNLNQEWDAWKLKYGRAYTTDREEKER